MSDSDKKPEPPAWHALVRNVSTNVANIQYPSDIWGTTSALRKEFAMITGKLNGHPAKTEILLATLAVMASHVQKRAAKDNDLRSARRARIVEGQQRRVPLERFHTAAPAAQTR